MQLSKRQHRLQNKVIDLEVEAGTPAPTVDPSVRVILVGHSMGGIVAAETLLSIARDRPVPIASRPGTPSSKGSNTTSSATTPQPANKSSAKKDVKTAAASSTSSSAPTSNPDEGTAKPDDDAPTFLFPFIQGILAFDTPYLGIHPGVVAHGAEAHWNTASAAYNAYHTAQQFFGSRPASPAPGGAKTLPATNSSGGWGKYAMFAGGAAAIAAAGSAAYMGRTQISAGWSWVGSHLEFVGCLARGAELAQRVDAVVRLSERYGIGFADFYAVLGHTSEGQTSYAGQVLGEERTFCIVPKEAKQADKEGKEPQKKRRKTNEAADDEVDRRVKSKGTWVACLNKKAGDEITAHKSIFTPLSNPGYYHLSETAKNTVVQWVDKAWYESSGELPDDDEDLDDAEEDDEDEDEDEDPSGKGEHDSEGEKKAEGAQGQVSEENDAEPGAAADFAGPSYDSDSDDG